MKYKAIFLFSVLLMVNSVYSQFDEQELSNQFNTSKYAEHLKNDASTFLNVSAGLIKSPFQFDKNDLLLTSSILGLTAATFPMDEPLRKVSLQSQSKILDNISYVTEKFGDPKIGFAFGGMLYGGGLIFGNEDIRETGQMLAEAVLFTGLITTGAKMMFNRSRPFVNDGSYDLDIFEFESDFDETSLPSGHTSTAFTMATVLSQRIDNIYASVALYSMASLTALQRVYDDRHWFSDTILGAALGTFIGLKVVKLHENNSESQSGLNYSLFPRINSGNYGMGLALQF